MLIPEYSKITYEEFIGAVNAEGCGTLSKYCRPLLGEVAWRGECAPDEFLGLGVFPVWYLGPNGGDFRHWDQSLHPDYKRIPLRDALRRGDFQRDCREDLHPSSPKNRQLHVLLLHCCTCAHAAIIDGNHRLAAWSRGEFRGDGTSRLRITGLSGLAWPSSMHDMNKVCRCLCPENAVGPA